MTEIEVIEEKENPLLDRREVTVKISHKGARTPTRSEIRKKLIATLSAGEDRLILGSLEQQFGASQAVAKVKIYKSKERAMQIESPHKIKKNFPEEKKPVEEAPKPEAEEKPVPAEAPAQEEPSKEKPKKDKAPPKETKKSTPPKETEKKPAEKAAKDKDEKKEA